jgi:hypothetical protein
MRAMEPEIKLSARDLPALPVEPSDESAAGFRIVIDPERHRALQAMEARQWLVIALNLPSGLVQLPYVILSPTKNEWTPRNMDFRSWRAISWPVIGIPFWWCVGRGIEALIAVRRRLVQPRITWLETIAALAFSLFCGAATVCLPLFAGGDDKLESKLLITGFGLWAVLGAAVVTARVMQWRIRTVSQTSPTPAT